MQLVSRQTLKKLASSSSSSIHEVDSSSTSSFSYQEFQKEYNAARIHLTKNHLAGSKLLKDVYDMILEVYIQNHCPPIEYIAEGSSRAAFACQGGMCLKIAINEKGIAQNKQEANTFNKAPFSCFTRVYDFQDDYSSLMTECCSKTTYQDFRTMFHDSFDALLEVIEDVVMGFDCDIQKARTAYEVRARLDESYVEDLEIVDSLMNDGETQWDVLRHLISFYRKFGPDSLEIGDLFCIENWGLAIRDGKIVPVILDFGLDSEVWRKHYG